MAAIIERRFLEAGVGRRFRIEQRQDGESTVRSLVGYPAVYESPTMIGRVREIIKRGAFTDAVKSDDIRVLVNHDASLILGRSSSGTARFTTDDVGLRLECDLPETQAARDLIVSVERGDITGGSFGFRMWDPADEHETFEVKDGVMTRELHKVHLLDAGPVTFPAYQATEIALRSMSQWLDEHPMPNGLDLLKRELDLLDVEL